MFKQKKRKKKNKKKKTASSFLFIYKKITSLLSRQTAEMIWILFLIFRVILVEGKKFPPLSIISPQGLCKSPPTLNKYYKASLFENSPNRVSDMAAINVLDCTVHNEDCIFANRLLNSDFTNSNNGAYFYLD